MVFEKLRQDHANSLIWLLVHAAPYLVVVFSLVSFLIGADWIDTPARSARVEQLQLEVENLRLVQLQELDALKRRLSVIEEQQHELTTKVDVMREEYEKTSHQIDWMYQYMIESQ